MCFIYFAKSINIYYRDKEKITNADIIFTYIFILSMITIVVFYSIQYYNIVIHDMNNCEKHNTEDSCLRTEIIYIVVPYVGIIYSFFEAFYKITYIMAFIVGCLCCCKSINQKNIDDTNNSDNINIELVNI
jgi:heme/copper-type cytochrome/quinol oxidase subunit 2